MNHRALLSSLKYIDRKIVLNAPDDVEQCRSLRSPVGLHYFILYREINQD